MWGGPSASSTILPHTLSNRPHLQRLHHVLPCAVAKQLGNHHVVAQVDLCGRLAVGGGQRQACGQASGAGSVGWMMVGAG